MTSSSESPTNMMLVERILGSFLPLEISLDAFTKAYELPIGEHVEKNYKGLSYLSWPFAFRYLKECFPSVYVAFEEREHGWPVFGQDGCWLLRPYLTDGQRRTTALVFPLMDNKHNALAKLDARAVSDNIQRASVKCIATFTGLGLKLYSGEDIPRSDNDSATTATGSSSEEAAKPASRASKKAAPTPATVSTTGATEAPATPATVEFDGKAALLGFCKANPLGKADERSSMMLGKNALQNLGLSKGEDIKDAEMFANVISTLITSWTKDEGIKMAKDAMEKEIDDLRSACLEGNAIEWTKDYVIRKK
ncbi:DUF1071 domain-containing protein [bacterium]|nr:DUF1071 domain-containing protein [bacterium]